MCVILSTLTDCWCGLSTPLACLAFALSLWFKEHQSLSEQLPGVLLGEPIRDNILPLWLVTEYQVSDQMEVGF